ncbi:protein export cytoplasm protein SecA, partial [bacterium]|nr:protein export cytoplasm protein SecA [bacterium]
MAKQIDLLEPIYRKMSDEELSNQTNIFLDELKRGKKLEDILPYAFAVAREAIYRVHGLFAFHVQIVGAIIANNGDFAEMYTGEGKTLTVVIVAYLNALLKKGVHVVTVNEYLVKRDAQFCAQCLNPLGITVGYNLASMYLVNTDSVVAAAEDLVDKVTHKRILPLAVGMHAMLLV